MSIDAVHFCEAVFFPARDEKLVVCVVRLPISVLLVPPESQFQWMLDWNPWTMHVE